MANPAVIRPDMTAGDHFLHQQEAIAARRARLLINHGILLVSSAASVITHTAVSNTSAGVGGPPAYHLVIAFLLFLLGVSMLMLELAADQFPGAARVSVGVAIARAIHHYLFGGGD